MKNVTIFLILLAISVCKAQETPVLKKTDVNGKVSILVPTAFHQLSEQDLVQQFGMVHMPEAAYASANNEVTLAISIRVDSVSSTIKYKSTEGKKDSLDLAIEKSFYKASLGATYEEITFLKDAIVTIDKHPFMVFEFESTLVGKTSKGAEISTKQYNYLAHGYKGKKKYIITFSCPLEMKATWQPLAQQIIDSVKI